MLSDAGDWGVSECSGRPIFIFLLKKIGFAPWPGFMLSQTLVYCWQDPFDSDVRQWSHPLMILIHCCGQNQRQNRTRRQVECDVLGFAYVLFPANISKL